METVEAATGSIPEPMLEDAEDALPIPLGLEPEVGPRVGRRGSRRRGQAVPSIPQSELVEAGVIADTDDEPSIAPAADPWSGLLQAGMALLQQFTHNVGKSSSGPGEAVTRPGDAIPKLVHRDERTGETYLKLPMPAPEVLEQALRAVNGFLESFRR
jgi:hypothetical protein